MVKLNKQKLKTIENESFQQLEAFYMFPNFFSNTELIIIEESFFYEKKCIE